MTPLITSDEIGEAWANIEADWPRERFQELKRLVKDTLHDAQFAVAVLEEAARQRTGALNQCDGCRRGLPKNVSGNHLDGGLPVIGCTAHLYVAPHQRAVADLIADMASGKALGLPAQDDEPARLRSKGAL